MARSTGRHFRQIRSPANVLDRVLRTVSVPMIDHRGPEFGVLGVEILETIKPVFGTNRCSGSGIWVIATISCRPGCGRDSTSPVCRSTGTGFNAALAVLSR
jgi:alanine-glyoxylate transaminase/serine-glyoxylate transaminase/serine-pyruvate transaminase